MQYSNGKEIKEEVIEFNTQKGSAIKLTLLLNARLGGQGQWLPSTEHDIKVSINGERWSFQGAEDTEANGYCVKATSFTGRKAATIPTGGNENSVRAMIEKQQASMFAFTDDEDENPAFCQKCQSYCYGDCEAS